NNRGHGTNEGFLDALSRDALGHALDPATQQYLLFLLQQFTPRSVVAQNVFQQIEAIDRMTSRLFVTFLRRQPDPGAFVFFRAFFQRGGLEKGGGAPLLAWDEYTARLKGVGPSLWGPLVTSPAGLDSAGFPVVQP